MLKRFFKQTIMPLGRWCHPEYNKNVCSIDKQFIKSDYSTSDNCFSNSQKCKDNIGFKFQNRDSVLTPNHYYQCQHFFYNHLDVL